MYFIGFYHAGGAISSVNQRFAYAVQSLDDDYSKEIIDAVDKISKKYNVTTYQVKDGGTQEWNNEYNKMMQDLFDMAKQKAISIKSIKYLLQYNAQTKLRLNIFFLIW